MSNGEMKMLPWLVAAVLVAVGVTGDSMVTGDLTTTSNVSVTGDSGVTSDPTAKRDAGATGEVDVVNGADVIGHTGYDWRDFYDTVNFDELNGGYTEENEGDAEADGPCPHVCQRCGSNGYMRTFHCKGQELKYIDDKKGSFMEVVCSKTDVPMNCSWVPPLPARRAGPLQRVEVTSCILPPAMPISCATGGEGTKALLLRSAMSSLTADNVRGLDTEDLTFIFEQDVCHEVPVEAIKALPKLTSVRLQNLASPTLRGDMFLASPSLEHLEISMSGIKSLPSNAFRGLDKLANLSLFLNDIAHIAEDAFNGLESLQRLILNDNPLSSFPPRALPSSLRVLLLKRVPLQSLDERVFEGLVNLKQVTIEGRSNLTLGPRTFSRLPSLTTLEMPNSGVSTLPVDLFEETSALLELILSRNRISSLPAKVFSPLKALRKLDLSNNQISLISNEILLPLASLTELNLDGNRIQALPRFLFSSLGNLKSVSLARNQLASISYDSFTGAGSLVTLSLAHNNLTWSAEDAEYSSPFNSLLHLQELDLSHNGISCVFSDLRFILLNLTKLDLSYNNITTLTAADLQFIGGVTVDFRNNKITTAEPLWWGAPSGDSRATLILDHNPFRCDCHLYHFLTLVHRGDKKYSVDDATCSSPASLARRTLRQLDVRDVTCVAPNSTNGCDCLVRPALNRIECICNNTRVPSVESSGFPDMYLRLTRLPIDDHLLRLPPYVSTLNLTNLHLTRVPKLLDTIKTVDLTRNHIAIIPERVWKQNITFTLAYNPLLCECSTTDQVRFIQTFNFSKISDYNKVICSDGSYIQLKDWNTLCDVYIAALTGTVSALALILLAVIGALLYRYWIDIQVIMYSRGWLLHLLPQEEIDSDKKYDVFVAFASEDEKFVLDEIIPKLDGYNLLVQDRDWIAGNTIPAEIHRSIEESRRTLIILTSNFLKSMWAAEQFRTIHTQATNDKRLRAVVVLLDVKKKDLDKDTKMLLSLSTLLKYKESLFWEKVRYALPRKACEYRRVECRVNAKEVALWKGSGVGLDVVLNVEGKLVNNGFVKDVSG